MKRRILAILLLIFLLAGCGAQEQPPAETPAAPAAAPTPTR